MFGFEIKDLSKGKFMIYSYLRQLNPKGGRYNDQTKSAKFLHSKPQRKFKGSLNISIEVLGHLKCDS